MISGQDLQKCAQSCPRNAAALEVISKGKVQPKELRTLLGPLHSDLFMFLQIAELNLNCKSAQNLAREMTEKVRQSEQARSNEEKLRKLSEAREGKAQGLLLEEIHRRKEAETLQSILEVAESTFFCASCRASFLSLLPSSFPCVQKFCACQHYPLHSCVS